MIRHYFQSALARLATTPVTTAAKVLTLALGLFAMIAVAGVVAYWRSSDSQITPPGGRAIVFTTSAQMVDGSMRMGAMPRTSPVLAKYLREEVPELKTLARFDDEGDIEASTGERSLMLKGANAEPGFLDIFHFNFVAGDPKTALQREDGVILTQEAATRLFGAAPALGRSLVLGGQRNVTITGVIGPIPEPSQFTSGDIMGDLRFDYVSVMPPDPPGPDPKWGNLSTVTYGLMPEDGSLTLAELDRRLAHIVETRVPAKEKENAILTLGASRADQSTELLLNAILFGISGGMVSVAGVFFGLGLLVLGVACLNYANLATAQAVSGAKQIGMRRVLGARRLGIFMESWVEAGIAALLALAFTGICLWLASPVIAAQTGIDLVGVLMRSRPALTNIAIATLAATIAAGLYPAFVVSRVKPVEALRSGKVKGGPRAIQQILVGLQFASASMLLIALIIVGQQNAHIRTLALQRNDDPVVVLPQQARSGVSVDTLRQQLAAYPQIKVVSYSLNDPWRSVENEVRISRDPGSAVSRIQVLNARVGFNYFDLYDQKVLAGRVFTADRDSVSTARAPDAPPPTGKVMLDATAVQKLGFASPQAAVGAVVYGGNTPYEIIGVVETRMLTIQSGSDAGVIYGLYGTGNSARSTPLIRISKDDVDGGVAAIRKVWKETALEGTPDFRFEDELFQQAFSAYERVGLMFLALSLLAFLISAIGLFGMAVHTTQRRRHEIGVRKTLGSSAGAVAGLLLIDFSKPVIIANLLAWPLAWVAAQIYLSPFSQRIEVGPLPFLASLAITLVIAWLAVGAQTVRAANLRPADVLRRS